LQSGTATGESSPDWSLTRLNLFRPVVAAFSLFSTWSTDLSAVWRVRTRYRWLALLVASIAGIVAGYLGPSLLQPGPILAFVSMGSRWPAGKFLLLACIAALTV
jgi:hypothetical protein